MQINIGASIIDFLQDYENLYLPGLGILYLKQARTGFKMVENELMPPFSSLGYRDEKKDIEDFVVFLAEFWDIPEHLAENEYLKYANHILESLVKKSKYTDAELGTWQIENRAVKFSSHAYNYNLAYSGLPSIQLNPIVRTPEIIEETIVTKPAAIPTSKSNKYRTWWQKNRVAALALVSFIIIFSALMKMCSNQVDNTDPLTLRSIENLKEPQEQEVPSSPNQNVQKSDSQLEEKPSEQVISEYQRNIDRYSNVLTDEVLAKGCVIIVGSFTSARNTIKMRDKIIRAGLQPYTETHNGFTRVGLIFDCGEHDLVQYLQNIRKTFDPLAWYLIPKFDVNY